MVDVDAVWRGHDRFSSAPFQPIRTSGSARRQPAGHVMAPDAHPVVAIDLPRRVVDLAAAPAELDVESGRRPRVEGERAIVRVHAERVRDLDAGLETPVVRAPDV